VTEGVPHVDPANRSEVESLGNGVHQIVLRYGFMEHVDVPRALSELKIDGLEFKLMETTYFLGRETLITSKRPAMTAWRAKLFTVLARNERDATSFFRLPPNRVVELGAQIEL
jgi:KUP system potassium uptake protein